MSTPSRKNQPTGESAPADTPDSEPTLSTAVWTVPNAISSLRIVLIVVFAILLATHHDAWAISALIVAGISDFLDGFLARRWNQVTALGRVLDPTADRMLTIAVIIGLALRSVIPWWLVAILLLRDVIVGAALLHARRSGVTTSQVTFVGKLATLLLYVFLPLAYLGYDRWDWLHVVAIAGAVGAAALYWWAGMGYVVDIRDRARAATSSGAPTKAIR